jgi:hypothetical protein
MKLKRQRLVETTVDAATCGLGTMSEAGDDNAFLPRPKRAKRQAVGEIAVNCKCWRCCLGSNRASALLALAG